MATLIVGLSAKLYRGAAGAQAAMEMKNVKDVTLNLEKGEGDVTTRAAAGWRNYIGTLKDASLEFEMNYDTTDSDYSALLSAYLNNTALAFFVSDGSGNGLDADWVITGFNTSQPLDEAVTVSVTAKPTYVSRAPSWVGAS